MVTGVRDVEVVVGRATGRSGTTAHEVRKYRKQEEPNGITEPKPDEAPECQRWRERPRIKYNCTRGKLLECRVKTTHGIVEEVEGENPECASWRAKRADRRKMHDLSSQLERKARHHKQQGNLNLVKSHATKTLLQTISRAFIVRNDGGHAGRSVMVERKPRQMS